MSRKSFAGSGQQPMKLIEAGVTLFRPAEIPVVSTTSYRDICTRNLLLILGDLDMYAAPCR